MIQLSPREVKHSKELVAGSALSFSTDLPKERGKHRRVSKTQQLCQQAHQTAPRSACKMAGPKRSRRFLEGVRNSFLLQAVEGPAGVMHRWICSSLTGKTWLWDMVISGSFGCGAHKTVGFKIPKGGRKESSREQMVDFRRALSFCSRMTAGMLRQAAVRGRGGQEEKQTYQEMSVCGGMKPTTTSLTFLFTDELIEVMKSIQS